MKLLDRLNNEWIFFDGGTGSILQDMGLAAGELPETWNLRYPDRIKSLYRGYLEAGSTIFNANTFGANRLKYPENLKEIVESGVRLAVEARREAGREEDAYVALDLGPTGKLLKPMGDLDFDDAVNIFSEVVRIGAAAGADLVLIETMNDSYEAKAAVLAAKESCSLPVFITLVFDEKGKMLTGGTPEAMTAMLEGLRVDALGINCSLGPRQMLPIVKRFTACSSTPIIVNPNAGLPRVENGRTTYDVGPAEFSDIMCEIAELGVQGIGGCCGTTPEYIRETIRKVTARLPKPKQVTEKHRSVISSFSQCVEIGPRPIIVGERINPTGKKKFKEALRNHDIDYILSQGLEQESAGADALDVNVGLPEIDEVAMLTEVMQKLQSITALPLQLDTTNLEALESALRRYNGKAMINSVNGKQESMDAVFPLVQKYGGVVVSLALDEAGIPDNADDRIRIARHIYEEAAKYGIRPEDIVIDGLAMTVSSDPGSALVTLETLRRVRDELNGHSILGVSNISFGLPAREIVNSAFFTMAMQDGLSCAIINPNNEAMMRSFRSYLALTNRDPNFTGFITAYQNYKGSQTVTREGNVGGAAAGSSQELSLFDAIKRGIAGQAAAATREALKTQAALDVVNTSLIPALDVVGKEFEQGTLFLPQLLMAAEAAQAAFDVVKESMSGAPRELKGKVILATVKGDIHDIGKNIVKVMLENYGFDVIDLGRDVPPETIVEAAIAQSVPVVGLSALMTTTVVSMEETIRQLRIEKPDTKVVVGGAVMTQEYADQIGADCYAKDAMATVRFCDSVFDALKQQA